MIKERIQNDLKEAIKRKDIFLSSVLRFLLAAIKNKELEKRAKLSKTEPIESLQELSFLTEEEIIEVISSQIKKRKEAVLEFEKGGRDQMAASEKKEIEILTKYLPEQISEREIRELVIKTIKESKATSLKETGKIMALLMPQIKGRADGSLVKKIVEEEITKQHEQDRDY